MVASAAMCSCALSGVFLGSFMCTLIVLCRRWGLDPGKQNLFSSVDLLTPGMSRQCLSTSCRMHGRYAHPVDP